MHLPLQLGRHGSVGMMAAIAGLALLCFGGVSVDLERAWLVRGRLQTALDAAGLAAARTYAQSSCTTTFEINGGRVASWNVRGDGC